MSRGLRITGTLSGLDEALRKTEALALVGRRKWRDAVEYVLKQLRSYARANAPFKDRTGRLRRSIDYEMAPGGEPAGTLYAGELYGIFVERREGYWVLQGAIDFYEPKLQEIFRGQIQITEPDLAREARKATVYYRELRGAS